MHWICQFLIIILLIPLQSFALQTSPAKHGMVVSEKKIASEIGADILRRGGNAIDAAVAVGYALAVVDPCCGNLGGGGFMTIHLANGKNIFINFREKAGFKAKKNMFLGKSINNSDISTKGYLLVAVPGTVLGLDSVLQKYGTMNRKQVMAPAIRLAQEGYVLTSYDIKLFNLFLTDFREHENVATIFLKNNHPYQVGDHLVQKDLANTLNMIAQKGPDIFYKGNIAQEIVKSSQIHGGILTLNDFAKYHITESQPILCQYHEYTIFSASTPSSGGITLCEMLNILENFPLKKLSYRSTQSIHMIVEAMRYSFADRNMKLGDSDFVKNPVNTLISKQYAKELSDKIQHSQSVKTKKSTVTEQSDTTHYSVIDNKGNAVAVTYTINGFFGARVIAGNTGFFLNNEMDDFATQPGKANKFGLVQYDKNDVEPGKRPLSSMTPSIVMKNGNIVMVIGSPGGPRIITSVLLTLLNKIDYGMNIQNAVDAPRFHYQGQPNFISVETDALAPKVIKELEALGYQVEIQKPWGAVEAIWVSPQNGLFYGAKDKRRPDGAAVGY